MGDVIVLSLAQRLALRAAEAQREMPEGYYAAIRKSVAYLRDSGLFDGALKVGEPLPPFRLKNAAGDLIDSGALLEKGPLVISFFRGDWCRFCRETLLALAEIDDEVRELGATQVAITPDLQDATAVTVRELALPFDVLSDAGSAVGLSCGIVYRVPDDVVEAYHAIHVINRHGSADFFLPIPAVFIADWKGIVRLSFVEPDYQKRLEPRTILETLAKLKD